MENNLIPESLRRLAIPGRVEIAIGHGQLPLVKINTPWSTAEIYLLGSHVTGFQKAGEPPLLFMSAKSWFATGKPIRGGVPICYPWFGPREGGPGHGLARLLVWELAESSAAPDGRVTVRLRLPQASLKPDWSALRTEFVLTVAETLTMELIATNTSADQSVVIENCLHTYLQVGDVDAISLGGLQNAPFDDFAFGANGARRNGDPAPLRITQETNRVYPDNTSTVEVRDENLKRTVRVEKSNSKSTVVWNPWTTQGMPKDWGQAEHRQMVCVESGNVKQDKLSLAPGQTAALKVVLSSVPLK